MPRSLDSALKKRARSLGSGPGDSVCYLHTYAARSLPLWGLAGIFMTVFCGSRLFTVSGPTISMNRLA